MIWIVCAMLAVARRRRYAGRVQTLIETLKWYAAISGIIAAFMVSLDSGRRVTGWGMVIFVTSSIAWITGAVLSSDEPLGTQNAVLLGINSFGVYRYLFRRRE